MLDVTVIEDSEAAAVPLDPVRARLPAERAAGSASAAMPAGEVGSPRQVRPALVRPSGRGRRGDPLGAGVHGFAPGADGGADEAAGQDWPNGAFGQSRTRRSGPDPADRS